MRVLLLVIVLMMVPASAAAAPRSIMQDDTRLLRSGPAVRDATLDEMRALGADTVRVLAVWGEPLAPLDGVMAAAEARGLDVLLTPTGPGPRSASTCRPRRPACLPSPAAYGRFVRRLAERYPDHRLWAVWNEPNVSAWLSPQFDRRGRAVAPRHYRRLVRAAAAGLRRAGHAIRVPAGTSPGAATLLVGELASIGQARRSPATRVMAAEPFVRAMFRGRRLRATGFSLHPYTLGANAPVCARGGAGQLPPARLGRLRALLPPRLGIWLTEAGFQTDPPDPVAGVRPAAQATRINQLEWIASRSRRLRATAQYLLVDDARREGFQSGLRFADGRAKPALAAYRLPLWIQGARLWARVRPAAARERVTLERRTGGGRWRAVRRLTTDREGTLRATVSGRREWRVRWGPFVSRPARASRSCAGGL